MSSGKWAWKITTAASTDFGVVQGSLTGTESAYTATSGEVLEFEFNADTGVLEVSVDGGAYTGVATGLTSGPYFPLAKGACTADFGQQGFTVDDSTFKYLHTGNLPAPAITDPSSAFNVLEFSGTGAERDTVFGGNSKLSPDLTIFRDDLASGVWAFTDKVRGATEELDLASTSGGENTVAEGVKNFAPSSDELDGVTLGTDVDYNADGIDITMYGWKEGVTQGFDIVTYTGNASATQTVGHSLGVKPGYMILMRRDTGMQSTAWHAALTGDNYMVTMSTVGYGAETASSSNFAASHDLDNFVVDNTGNTENGTYVMYLWADVPGFQKHGSFTGNGSDDGPFIWTGFRPRCLHLRRFDGNRSPYIYNTAANPFNQDPGTTGSVWGATYVELALNIEIDILSNGFKLRESAADINGAGITKHMWSAWAEAPFGGEGVSQARAR